MFPKVECGTLGLITIESLPEIQISHFIACKDYDEKITTINTCRIYNDIFNRKRESNQVHNKRILVVDDEYDISSTIKIVLEQNGFIVDSFNDASQALVNFMIGIYDLVILDVKMPVIDGFSLYEKIKKL